MNKAGQKESLGVFLFSALTFLIFIQIRPPVRASEEGQALRISSFSATLMGADVNVNALVSDGDGNPLPGVAISFRDINGRPYTTITDSSGRFKISIHRSLLPSQLQLRVEVQGFLTREYSYDLPVPEPRQQPPRPEPKMPPKVEPKPDLSIQPQNCPTEENDLQQGQGIGFDSNTIVKIDQSVAYDVCFSGGCLKTRKGEGEIVTVGDKGAQSLCDINYPVDGYVDSIRAVENHVYLFVSKKSSMRVEIRVTSLNDSDKVAICYHQRRQ